MVLCSRDIIHSDLLRGIDRNLRACARVCSAAQGICCIFVGKDVPLDIAVEAPAAQLGRTLWLGGAEAVLEKFFCQRPYRRSQPLNCMSHRLRPSRFQQFHALQSEFARCPSTLQFALCAASYCKAEGIRAVVTCSIGSPS